MFFHVFFCNIVKVNHFLHCSIILLHLFFSFLHIKSFLVPYAFLSTESIDCILLSSFKLKAILLISSVKTLCLSLLNLCCVFCSDFFFFNLLMFFLRFSVLIFFSNWFILFLSSVAFKQFL